MAGQEGYFGELLFEHLSDRRKWRTSDRTLGALVLVFASFFLFYFFFTALGQFVVILFILVPAGSLLIGMWAYGRLSKARPFRIYENGILFEDSGYLPFGQIASTGRSSDGVLSIRDAAGRKRLLSASREGMTMNEWERACELIREGTTAIRRW